MFACFHIFVLVFVGNVLCDATNQRPYIVGGTNATSGEFPYVVAIIMGNETACTGSILNSRWILTSANCFTANNNTSDYTILAGTTSLDSGGVRVNVSEIIPHPDFEPPATNDIALLKLASVLQHSSTVKPVKLSLFTVAANTSVTVVGWGNTSQDGTGVTNTLQKLNSVTIGNSACSAALRYAIPDNDICAFTEAGEGACYGDGGAPLLDSTGTQVGILSSVVACARGRPDIYTRVKNYLYWIFKNQL